MATLDHSTSPAFGRIMRAILDSGGLSRAEISRATALRPNTVCDLVDAMVGSGWLREAGRLPPARRTEREGRGRPAVRVEADTQGKEVLGLAIRPGRVEAIRLNLLGEPRGEPAEGRVSTAPSIGRVAGRLVRRMIGPRTAAVGVSSTGLVDEAALKLLFSSSAPHTPGLSLKPIIVAAGDFPVVLDNDVHALGDRWRLSHPEASDQTVMLVRLGDGAVGASIMPGGGPADAGVVRGGNELGHIQVPAPGAEVPPCYCGQIRCVERVFSTAMARRREGSQRRLGSVLRDWLAEVEPTDSTGHWIASQLAGAVANAVNLMRPHRVVWTTDAAWARLLPDLSGALGRLTAARIMPILRDRVQFECWRSDAPESDAVTAGHLALAALTGRRDTSSLGAA